MADIAIPDLQLRSQVTEEVNFPSDDGIQSYRVTAAQLLAYIAPVPPGSVFPYAGSTAPTGFLLCFGQLVSRVTYARLFAAIGTTYGAGDGSTTFALPDLRGRIAAGRDDMGLVAANRLTTGASGVNGAVLGAVGGAETHTLTTSQMPNHNHTQNAHSHGVNDPGHIHTVPGYLSGGGSLVLHDGTGTPTSTNTGSSGTGISIQSNTATNNPAGGDAAHNNVQPTIVLNYLIKL